MRLTLALFAVLSVFTLVCQPLLANEIPPQKNTLSSENTALSENKNSTYPVSFFSQYTPQNAMEMIKRIPGFSFDRGSNERGFGGNAGNVLINGARPTSKSGGLRDALERIPASQVLYIEILRGGVSAGEAAGQAVVANVIKKDITTSGTWGVKASREQNGDFKPQAEGSLAIKLGEWDTSFDTNFGTEPEYGDTFDAFINEFDANNTLISNTDEIRDSSEKFFTLNGEGSRDFAGGTLTLNASIGHYDWQRDTERQTYAIAGNTSAANELWWLDEDNNKLNTELGVDWVKVNQGKKLRIIALTSSTDKEYEYTEVTQFNEANTGVASEQNELNLYSKSTLETEHIVRMTYGQIGTMAFKPEFGIEVANNRLESDISSIENGIPEALEGADLVEELRGELFVNFVYSATSSLTLEGGITYEYSNIKAYSDEVQSQTFNFIKPRLSANYTLNEQSTFTLVAEHSVEQLDFNDFASSDDSTENRTTSGNDNLQPEQVSSLSAIYDWRFSERGSIDMTVYYEKRHDVHEEILLPSGNAGLGNAGDADFFGVKTNVNLPLDYILPNGLLEIEHSYKNSKLYDAIINDYRTIYNYIPHWLLLEFRQDFTQYHFSWGFQYKDDFNKTRYYVEEIKKMESNNRLSKLFIETTHFFDMKTRLSIRDVNVTKYKFTRLYYENDRNENFIGAEHIYRERGPIVELSFSGSF